MTFSHSPAQVQLVRAPHKSPAAFERKKQEKEKEKGRDIGAFEFERRSFEVQQLAASTQVESMEVLADLFPYYF